MTVPDFAVLAAQHTLGDDPVPDAVIAISAGGPAELVWRNDRFVRVRPLLIHPHLRAE